MVRIKNLEKDLSSTKDLLMQEHQIRNSLELEVKRLSSSLKILQQASASDYENTIHKQQQEIVRILSEKAEIERFSDLCREKIKLLESVRTPPPSQKPSALPLACLRVGPGAFPSPDAPNRPAPPRRGCSRPATGTPP